MSVACLPLLWNLQIDGFAELQGVGPQHHRVGLVVHHAEGMDQQDHARVDALLWHVFQGTPILASLQGLEPCQRVDFSVGMRQGMVGHGSGVRFDGDGTEHCAAAESGHIEGLIVGLRDAQRQPQ